MNWINAYIHAVKKELPAKNRDDLAEEFETLLTERLEEETGKSSAQLSEAEALEWLKKQEHPALAAAGYQERRSLVSEDSFPLFKLTLKYVLIGLLVAYGALTALQALGSAHSAYINKALLAMGGNLLQSSLIAFAVVTLIFHFFGDQLNAREKLASWNPKELKLPAGRWEVISMPSAIAALVFTSLFILLINGLLDNSIERLNNENFTFIRPQFTQAVLAYLPWFNGILITNVFLYCIQIVRRQWSTTTLIIHLILCLATVAILSQLRGVTPIVELQIIPGKEAAELEKLNGIINTSLHIAFIIAILVNIGEALRDIYRMVKLGTRRIW